MNGERCSTFRVAESPYIVGRELSDVAVAVAPFNDSRPHRRRCRRRQSGRIFFQVDSWQLCATKSGSVFGRRQSTACQLWPLRDDILSIADRFSRCRLRNQFAGLGIDGNVRHFWSTVSSVAERTCWLTRSSSSRNAVFPAPKRYLVFRRHRRGRVETLSVERSERMVRPVHRACPSMSSATVELRSLSRHSPTRANACRIEGLLGDARLLHFQFPVSMSCP